jgi:hypothetical protein
MFKALRGKGWWYHGHSSGAPPGNRDTEAIHDVDKSRFVCPLSGPRDLLAWLEGDK